MACTPNIVVMLPLASGTVESHNKSMAMPNYFHDYPRSFLADQCTLQVNAFPFFRNGFWRPDVESR